jgi:predicted DNA-binding transcriptional regulator AlpA
MTNQQTLATNTPASTTDTTLPEPALPTKAAQNLPPIAPAIQAHPQSACRHLLTQQEVANRLCVSVSTVKRLASDPESGFPKVIRFSDAHNAPRRYFADEVDAYLEMRATR